MSGPDYFSSTAASPSFLLQPTADFCHPCTSHFHALPYMDIFMLFLTFQPIPGLHTIYPAFSSPLTIKTLTISPLPAFLLFCAHQCISLVVLLCFLLPVTYLPTTGTLYSGADLGILIGGFFFRECISNNHLTIYFILRPHKQN